MGKLMRFVKFMISICIVIGVVAIFFIAGLLIREFYPDIDEEIADKINNVVPSKLEGITKLDEVKWRYRICGNEVVIMGVKSESVPDSLVIPSKIKNFPVTSIGREAFEHCDKLTSVIIPASVTNIGHYAFDGCSNLKRITMPDGVRSIGSGVFRKCSKLTNLTIPAGVASLGSHVFSDFTGLRSVAIPNGVTNIGFYAFKDCCELETLTISDRVAHVNPNAFAGCRKLQNIVIANGSKRVCWWMLPQRENLTSVTIPDGVVDIEEDAFRGCRNLASMKIPGSVTNIGNNAFAGCIGLTHVTIPSMFMGAEDVLFKDCLGTKKVEKKAPRNRGGRSTHQIMKSISQPLLDDNGNYVIPDGVERIASGTFYDCDDLTNITIPDSVTQIAASAFENCRGLTNVVMGKNVSSIGANAFKNCSGLSRVVMPDRVRRIGECAFGGCSNLYRVVINDGITIASNSFVNAGFWNEHKDGVVIHDGWALGIKGECPSAVVLPPGTRGIANGVFSDCRGLIDLAIPESVGSIGVGNVFEDTDWWCRQKEGVVMCGAWVLGVKGICPSVVDLPSGIRGIMEGAFKDCLELTKVTMPDSVVNVGAEAFKGCEGLLGMTMSKSVVCIERETFKGCRGLAKIVIPEGVVHIGQAAFEGCVGLSDVKIPESVTRIDEKAFENTGCWLDEHGIMMLDGWALGLQDGQCPFVLKLPKGTRGIAANAFSRKEMVKVVIPKGVKSIGDEAFRYCHRLESITIPNGIVHLGALVLYGSMESRVPKIEMNMSSNLRNRILKDELLTLERVSESLANVLGRRNLEKKKPQKLSDLMKDRQEEDEDEIRRKMKAEKGRAQNGVQPRKNVVVECVFELTNNVRLEVVKVPAGTFMMGSAEDEQIRSDKERLHRVKLTKDFWLGKFEVMQEQYEAVMGKNPSLLKKGASHPVENVSWNDASEFCRKLNEASDKLPRGYKFDLPTEAQWEYACRAGTTAVLNNGKTLTSADGVCNNLNAVAWYDKNSDGTHHPVGLKRANDWGLYDMHGNVFEWCKDWYKEHYYAKGTNIDPPGPSSHPLSLRVLRGGGWDCAARFSRSAARALNSVEYRGNSFGFRVALVPVQ